MSDFDMEDDEDVSEDDDDEDGPIDLRSLVEGKNKDVAEPPKKKQKK
jgi:hypothetical protein